jgi:hypothetical protein
MGGNLTELAEGIPLAQHAVVTGRGLECLANKLGVC